MREGATKKRGAKVNILIVDDNKQDLYLLQKILETGDYEVETAVNGEEALKKAREFPLDMIISDILMPKMDGFRLCREVRKDDKLKNIPFMFYTATYTDKKDREFALSLGAIKFIKKPREPAMFLKDVLNTIEEHKMGVLAPPKPDLEEEEIYLQKYNEVLIRKLEKKMLDLEKANEKLKGEMDRHSKYVDRVAHELRNPLQVLLNSLESFDPKGLSSEQEECIERIKKSTKEIEENIKKLTRGDIDSRGPR